jgi:predicted nucleic acid-binding protein
MRTLFDTDVLLDLLQDREPHAALAAALVARVERGEIIGYIAANTVCVLADLAEMTDQVHGSAKLPIRQLLGLFEIAPVNRSVLDDALADGFAHFNDAVIYEAARHVEAQSIVTRNPKNFERAELPIYLPQELETVLRATVPAPKPAAL